MMYLVDKITDQICNKRITAAALQAYRQPVLAGTPFKN